jgi:ATP-dependent helicase HrpA
VRAEFEAAVEAGRERLYECFDQMSGAARAWFEEARAVRRLLEGHRPDRTGAALDARSDTADETGAHLQRLLDPEALEAMPPAWLRQLPRYLKAEERRWQRIGERGSESQQILAELRDWSARYESLERSVRAELRFLPELEDLHYWIEEYRVSLYAQELRTVGPVSAARLSERAAVVEAWINR